MKSFIFKDQNGTVNVEIVTDLIHADAQNFTAMEVKGKTTDWETGHMNDFKQLPSNKAAYVLFAQENDLQLDLVDYGGSGSSTTLVEFSNAYYGEEGLGVDNL